jgi:TrmH family RNA methyltransferase
VQRLRRLASRRSARQAERRFVVEGATLLAEAGRAGAVIEAVFLDAVEATPTERDQALASSEAGAQVFELQRGVLARVCDAVSPQPIAAIVANLDIPVDDLESRNGGLVVVCAYVSDPGNLGTILRSAWAAGAGAVVCCAGSVDVYNPKTVRSSAGALFHVPVVAGAQAPEVLDLMRSWGLRTWATAARGGMDYTDTDLSEPTALVFGNESRGLAGSISNRVDGTLSIPMAGSAESLNVGAAAAVLCFEAARQRRARASQ